MKIAVGLLVVITCACALADVAVYDGTTGELENGFQSWSWATVNLQATEVVAPGDKYSISMVCQNYQALYLHAGAVFALSSVTSLNFLVNGGTTGGDPVVVRLLNAAGNETGNAVDITDKIQASTWVTVSLATSLFGIAADTQISGIWWQSNSASLTGTIYIDDITLAAAPPAPVAGASITIDVSVRKSVSPYIFGVNWASSAQLISNKYTVNRWGGEAVTRFAYDVDAENHASDWYFENLPNTDSDPALLPFNSTSDQFIQTSLQLGVVPIITTPIIGLTPIDRQVRCGFSVQKYGAQQKTDPYQPDCGNGIKPDGTTPITGNDPADTCRVINETFVLAWLNHIDQVAGKGQVQFFELDNEPGLWNVIHRDVHPLPVTYDELWNRTVQYAGAIKKAYPNSKVFGPIPWGWCEYMFSPADNCADGPDRKAHGDLPLLAWYIQQLGLYKQKYGVQLVDVIDVHIYPQATNVDSTAEDPATAALRLRSTRCLWDPSYTDESWVNEPIYLIPRIQQWIATYNPGLQVAVSEYNWGADTIVTGALAQAMILGIFASNDVFLATRWVAPVLDSKAEEGFRIYTNYDGNGARVQGDSVSAASNNSLEVEAYAFDNNGDLFVVIINKIDSPVPVTIFTPTIKQGTATLYSFSGTQALGPSGKATISNAQFTVPVVAWSATLAVITSS